MGKYDAEGTAEIVSVISMTGNMLIRASVLALSVGERQCIKTNDGINAKNSTYAFISVNP